VIDPPLGVGMEYNVVASPTLFTYEVIDSIAPPGVAKLERVSDPPDTVGTVEMVYVATPPLLVGTEYYWAVPPRLVVSVEIVSTPPLTVGIYE